MSKPKVIITLDGGVFVDLCSNTDVEYVVIDYDKHSDEPVIIHGPHKQDHLFRNGKSYELWENRDISLPISEEETEVICHLKECKF